MNDGELVKLYSGQILQLAGSIPHLGHLDHPMGLSRQRSPLCGSTVEIGVRLAGGRVADFAQDVKACALGQASASVLGRVVIGRSLSELTRARDQLGAMLAQDGPAPDGVFSGYDVLRVACAYKNRHASILLALNTTIAAVEAAQV